MSINSCTCSYSSIWKINYHVAHCQLKNINNKIINFKLNNNANY